jgi:hypothetical protein
MAWARDTTSGVLTHSGTTRDLWNPNLDIFTGPSIPLPSSAEVQAQCANYTHNVKVFVRGSFDGRTGYECGIEGSNVIIRKITFGVVAAALDTEAHGIASGETFTLKVRLTAETITCSVVKTSGAEVEVSYATTDLNRYKHWGFVSSIDGAVVLAATVAEVGLASVTVEDVLIQVAGGDVWASGADGERTQLIGSRAFPSTAPVSLAVLDGLVYGVGGGKAVVINASAKTVVAWAPTSGSLPGSTGTGTTTATIACQYRGRIWLAGIQDQSNVLYGSALSDAMAWDTGELAEGRAVAIGVGRNQQVGDAIIALSVAVNNTLIIGCRNSLYALLGDPADGGAEVSPLTTSVGCSGPNAITTIAEGVTAVHAPEGLFIINAAASPVSVSRETLAGLIQFARQSREDYTVTLVRDPARHGLHVCITPDTGTATHLYYDERIGQYQGGNGGFFPERYNFAPTCGTVWRGRPVFGTDNGYIVQFNDSDTPSDYGTTAIDAYLTLSLVDEEPFHNDTILDSVIPLLGSSSGNATMTIYGGKTPEAAYSTSERWSLGAYTLTSTPNRTLVRQRGPALAVQLRNATAGESFVFEGLDAITYTGRSISRAGWRAALAVGTPCGVPAGSSSGGAGSGSAISGPGLGSLPTGGSPGSGVLGGSVISGNEEWGGGAEQ